MKYYLTIYLWGQEGYTKDNPKKIREEVEEDSLYQAKKKLFNKYRKMKWWVYTISDGDMSIVYK